MRRTLNTTHAPGATRRRMRRLFRYLNRYFMTPIFRLGLGPLVVNPLTGYIMVLKTTGRRTGRVHYTPLNYAIQNGQVYCLAGWGSAAHWYRNLVAHPGVACVLPGETLLGVAEVVTDPDEALRAVRQVLKNAGLAGFALGFNPFTVDEGVLQHKTAGLPVIRIGPAGVERGSSDPGGWFWIVSWAMHAALIAWLIGWRRQRQHSGSALPRALVRRLATDLLPEQA